MISIGHFNKAIEITSQYNESNLEAKYTSLENIIKGLIQKGHFNKAIVIAEGMADKKRFFRIISEGFVRAGKMEKAIEVAKKAFSDRDNTFYINFLAEVCKTLVQEGELKKAKELAAAMPHKTTQNALLHIISPVEYYKTHTMVHRL